MSQKTTRKKSNRKELGDEKFDITSTTQKVDYKVNIKCKNYKQKELYNAILNNKIVFVKGSAGTGKTFLSISAALHCMKTPSFNIGKLIFSKPYIQAGSTNTGYLKGDLSEKILPYFSSFYTNLTKILGHSTATALKENGQIEDKLINFIRGETFGDLDSNGNPIGTIAILDEAQNTTVNEMKTFISRLGENSKLIILGDIDQVDIKLNRNEKNGLDDAYDRFQGLDNIAFLEFTEDDIVRDPFLIEIMKRYKI